MGGRGCARTSDGRVLFKKYYTESVAEAYVDGEKKDMQFVKPDVKKTEGARGLPLESDKPSEIYGELDNDGILKKIRIYDSDCIMSIDIDLHPIQTGGNPVLHYHVYSDSKNQEKKKKTGRSNEHFDIQDLPASYQQLVPLLEMKSSDIDGYKKRK